MNIRVCSKCGKIGLDQYDFYIRWHQREGVYCYRTKCIDCVVVRGSKYRDKNRSKCVEINRQYRLSNKEKIALYNKWYNDKHPEKRITNHYLSKYNITLEEYDKLLEKQDYRCIICGSVGSGRVKYKRLCVDHNHETGQVRGLLCHKCNMAIGYVKEDPQIIINMLNYMNYWKENGKTS